MKQKLITLFLDYFNNFLTVECFASYHGMSEEKARRVICLGKKLYENSFFA